jgi:spore germination protein KA/spore germination protein
MESKKKQKKPKSLPGPTDFSFVSDLKSVEFSPDIDENEAYLREIFTDCSDVVIRPFQSDPGVKAVAVMVDGLVKSDQVQRALEMLMVYWKGEGSDVEEIKEKVLPAAQISIVENYADMLDGVLSGDTAILLEGSTKAILAEFRGPNTRSVGKPSTEEIIRGPQEGFIENIRVNTSLLRRKIKTPNLKMKALKLGRHSRTNVAVAYMDGIVDPKLLEEVLGRLNKIDVDIILETGQLEEYMQDSAYSPFPQMQVSERPDGVAAALMNGRIAIFVDGTPMVMLLPTVFLNFLLTVEDHYERFQFATFLRWLRYAFLLLSLFIPAWYVASTTFHPEMIPTTLLLSFASAREKIPFPAVIEVLIMEIVFEALREAGIRLPKQIGAALSILGALIIGQASVEAGIVSAPVVIVVSITGIASFTIPQYNGAVALRMLRFPLIILASMFGIYGVLIGAMFIIGHMAKMRSFGVPYLSPAAPYSPDLKNALIRVPHWAGTHRPSYLHPQDPIRRGGDAKEIISQDNGMKDGSNQATNNTDNTQATDKAGGHLSDSQTGQDTKGGE